MRLLLGPPGSGKTTQVLGEFSAAARNGPARLIVPTATMARHLQHDLARRGEPVPPSWITTLSRFAATLAPGIQTADSSALALLASQELEQLPQLYPLLRDAPGLPAAIAAAIEELANSGCGALQWSSLISLDHRFNAQFGELYEAIERALGSAGLHLRAHLLAKAAESARERGAGVSHLWLDGFTLFSKAELALLEALGRHASVTLTLPEWPGAAPIVEQLQRAGARIERLPVRRTQPEIVRIQASSREREAEEIALQILGEHNNGRPWREMAVITRSEENYLALLERTFGRLGIPARAYFGRSVLREPAGVFFQRFAAAVCSRWDGETTLAFLRHPLCRAAREVQGAPWRKAMGKLPFQGLAALGEHLRAAAHLLAPFESWTADPCTPREWARRLPEVASLLEPPPAAGELSVSQLASLRLQSAAFRAITAAADSLTPLLPDEPLSFAAYWDCLEDGLREARIYPEDPRRDVVHLLDVQEARQWEIPLVFVCGLLEGEFPRRSSPDPILPDEIRIALRQQGFPVRTRAELEEEERFHFEIARTRATKRLILSWPERNEAGEANLRSFLLDGMIGETTPAVPARRFLMRPSRPAQPAPPPALQSDDALNAVRAIRASVSATSIESYLQCPFQFFAQSILKLEPLPPLPSERLDARFLGNLAHQILSDWHKGGRSIETITDEFWECQLRRNGLAETHQTLLNRAAMKRHLAAYAASELAQTDWQAQLETECRLNVLGVEIDGRADRVDVSPEGACRVYDFKYSGAQSIRMREEIAVQVELYAEALSRQENLRPQTLGYVALKDKSKLIGKTGSEESRESIAAALEKTQRAIEQFQSGRIEVQPSVPDLCQYCDFRDACRWQETAAEVAAGAGNED